MQSLRSWTLILLVMTPMFGGCERVRGLWSSAETEADAESETEAARLERERVAAETRRRQLEDADALVERWAARLEAAKTEDGAFIRHEGLTADDPWGRAIRVRYAAEGEDRETLDVRSAGPNGQFDDDDDLVRIRATKLDRGWWARNRVWVLVAIVWILIGLISAGGLGRRRRRKHERAGEPIEIDDVALALLYMTVAPLSLLFWLVFILFDVFADVGDVLD